jgi:hypothetical protein
MLRHRFALSEKEVIITWERLCLINALTGKVESAKGILPVTQLISYTYSD